MKFISLFITLAISSRCSIAFILDGINDCHDDPTLQCWYYDDSQCTGVYEAFTRLHCPLRCGFCPGKSPPCEDLIPDCADFGQQVCGDQAYQGYLRKNCRKFCGYCTVSMTTQKTTPAPISTTPASTTGTTSVAKASTTKSVSKLTTTQFVLPSDCQDVRSDCRNHLHACEGVFQTWAMTNCARTCGYCYNSPLCEDTADCVHLPSTVCTDPDLLDFTMTSCRKFCRFCNNDTTHSVKMTTQFVPTTTPSASMTSSFTMKIPKTAIP